MCFLSLRSLSNIRDYATIRTVAGSEELMGPWEAQHEMNTNGCEATALDTVEQWADPHIPP